MTQNALTGKVAVVTRGASGIGRATAHYMAGQRSHLVVADVNRDGAEEVAESIRARGQHAVAVRVDVTQSDQTDDMVRITMDELGRLDVLSSTAGIARLPTPAVDTDAADFDRISEGNVKGVWHTVRSAVPVLRTAGGGSIVITGSVMGERTRPGFAAYASSKAAANHLARTLALEPLARTPSFHRAAAACSR